MPFLIDTDVAIHLRDQATDVVDRISGLGELPLLSVITQVELENGVHRDAALTSTRRGAVDLLLEKFVILPFDAEVARAYRAIVADLGYSRRRVADRMVAATALAHKLTLITRNGGDFGDIPDLSLEIWASP